MQSKKINARIQKWRAMIKEGMHGDEELLKSRIRKGIPQAIRALAWPEIVRLREFEKGKAGQYTYEKLINTPSKSTYDITLDIPRTFPEEEDSKVLRKSLNNVLKAISIVYKKMGYCQGMNFLTLRLLQVIDDEQTFWLLHYLLQTDPGLMKNFIDPKRVEDETNVFSELMQIYVPKVNTQLHKLNITIHLFTVRWFMTLFSSTLKQQLFYRIFEMFLNEGWTAIYKVGLTLLKNHEETIASESFDGVVYVFNSEISQIADVDEFMVKVGALDISSQLLLSIREKVMKLAEAEANRDSRSIANTHLSRAASGYEFPRPQLEPFEELQFQRKTEEVTFQVFHLISAHKK